jgi:DNA polymerase
MFHLDYETFSTQDIGETGAYAYAEDPQAEVLMAAVAEGDGAPALWVEPRYADLLGHDNGPALAILEHMAASDAPVYAHNAEFERAVTRYMANTPVAFLRGQPHRWRCTAAMCRRAGLPARLADAAKALNLPQQKDTKGKALIRLFSVLQKDGSRVMPYDRPDKFAEFGEYCLQDVRTEQEVHRALSPWELKGFPLEVFQFDVRLNDRGIPVNVKALERARDLADEKLSTVGREFERLTGLAPSQRDKVNQWFQMNGVHADNLQRETVAELLQRHEADESLGAQALRLYSEVQYAAVKKVHTALATMNADGRCRGTFLYHGAGTGRWSGKNLQPQNFKKATVLGTKFIIGLLEGGIDNAGLEALYGNSLEALASAIRHFVNATLDADYNAIEARILPWMAGQQDSVERFRRYDLTGDPKFDPYRAMAAVIFERAAEDIGKDSQERQLGKQVVLGAGYQMGPSKFLDTCHKYGLKFVDARLAERAIDAFRATNPKVKQLWYSTEEAAINALLAPGQWCCAGPKLRFQSRQIAGITYLLLQLPSGRCICYPHAKVEHDPKFDKQMVTYWGQLPGKAIWGRIKLYGGKFCENADQGIAADVMGCGAIEAERQGFDVWALVHDQALGTALPGQTPEQFAAALTTMPAWADGLPLKAEAKLCNFYAK